MPLPDGTLLVCFVAPEGESESAPRPRLLVWQASGPIEEVRLKPATRHLLSVLATPPLALPEHLSAADRELRLVAALGAALPVWSAERLRAALSYSGTHAWRLRDRLARELGERGLGDRLVDGAGGIWLRGTTTDLAVLYTAMRDERPGDAALLLRAVAGERPGRLAVTPPPNWPTPALRRLEEVVADALAAASASESPDSTALTVRARPLEIVPRTVDRRPTRRRLARGLAAALALAAVAGASAHLATSEPEPGDRPIPDAVAGSWPEDASSAIANLTRAFPFDSAETAANRGDVLLLRQRFRVGTRIANRAAGPVEALLEFDRTSPDSVQITSRVTGADPAQSLVATVDGVRPAERLRAVPATTRLLDVDGKPLRRLPTLRPSRALPLTGLERGKVYFLSTRVRVRAAPVAARGAFGNDWLDCAPRERRRVAVGAALSCELALVNWGPRSLRRTILRLTQRSNGWYVDLSGSIASPDADPPRAELDVNSFDQSQRWKVAYVHGSARVRIGRTVRRPRGNPLRGGLVIGDVPVRADASFRNGGPQVRLTLRLRVVGAVSRGRG